ARTARRDPGEAVVDRAPIPFRGRSRRDRLHQPRLGAVLLELRSDSPHRGRPASYVPVLAARMGFESHIARRELGLANCGLPPLRRAAQGAQAPRERTWIRPCIPLNEPNWGMMSPRRHR